MDHPQKFLLQKIVDYQKNGLNSLGKLNGVHVADIVKIMKKFAELTAVEVIDRLNKGQEVEINGTVFAMKQIKKKKFN